MLRESEKDTARRAPKNSSFDLSVVGAETSNKAVLVIIVTLGIPIHFPYPLPSLKLFKNNVFPI